MAGISYCLKHSTFFPTIAEIGTAAYGTEHWYESIVHSKRLAFKRQAKQIESIAHTAQERAAIGSKVHELIQTLGKKMEAK